MSGWLRLDITVPLDRITLQVRWNPVPRALGVFGHSGSGKTTLLETVAGLRAQARGCIEVNGRVWLDTERGVRLPPERRHVGYVPQDALLFPHLDVMGNLLAGRRRARSMETGRLEPARVLEVLELSELRGRSIASLSGGERQRVALGRALCSGPSLLLLDEPLAGLDAPLRYRILPYLTRIQDEFDLPTVHVSHDPTEARALSSEVLVLAEGRAVRTGPPDEVFTDPLVLPMARAEGFENVLRARVIGRDGSVALAEIEPGVVVHVSDPGVGVARELLIALRAEDLILATHPPVGLSAQNILPGVVREIRQPDGAVMAIVRLGKAGPSVLVALTRQACDQLALRPDMPVHVLFKTQACRVLVRR